MILEQFVYTAATRTKTGYQIIARSKGITDDIISQLNQYVFPLGIDPSEFEESRSLLILKNNKIAFSRIKNIGIGYDGRSDTFYNHTIVMNIQDFKEIDYDTRILENFYFENPRIEGSLSHLKIESQKIPLKLRIDSDFENSLFDILTALFNREKIALVGNHQPQLIQRILSIVPPSVRLISFSSLVNDIERQSRYDFIITKRRSRSISDKKFKIIEMGSKSPSYVKKEHYEEGIFFLSNLIKEKEIDRVSAIYQEFEKITTFDFKNKIIMLTYYDKFQHSVDKLEKQDSAYVILECLKNIDDNAIFKYFNDIKEFLHYEDVERYASEFEIKQILSESSQIQVEISNLERWLGQLSDRTSKSRMRLLQELFLKKKEEFVKQGSKLLEDCRYSTYRHEIYQFFIETKELHACIFKILDSENLLNIYKQNILESILIQSAKYNPNLLLTLIEYDIYNLKEKYDVRNFRYSIRNMLERSELFEVNFKIILQLLDKIFFKVQKTLFQDASSNELSHSVIKQHVKIISVLHQFLENYPIQRLSELEKDHAISMKNKFREFIDKNDVPDPPVFWNPFRIFGLD